MSRRDDVAARRHPTATPLRRRDTLLRNYVASRVGQIPVAVGELLDEAERLRECLEEAADWLDADLAHAPGVSTAQADRELIARWRAALEAA